MPDSKSSSRNSGNTTFTSLSFILPTRNAFELVSACVESLMKNLKGLEVEFEIIVVDNRTTEPRALKFLKHLEELNFVQRIQYDRPFNYAEMINRGASLARYPVLVAINNDLKFSEKDIFRPLLKHISNPSTGVVAPVLLNLDGSVQSSGLSLGYRGVAGHITQHLSECAKVSAVSFAIAMLRKTDFVRFGGLDTRYKVGLNDVDFCLRARDSGLNVVVCSESEVTHVGSASRGSSFGVRRIFRASLEVLRFLKEYPNLEDGFSKPAR